MHNLLKLKECPRCSGSALYTTEEIKPLIIDRCKKLKYVFLNEETYTYSNSNSNEIRLKCEVDDYEWMTNRNNFLCSESKCAKCMGFKNNYLTYNEALLFVRSLKLNSKEEWVDYCKSGKKPDNIPSNPYVFYKKNVKNDK